MKLRSTLTSRMIRVHILCDCDESASIFQSRWQLQMFVSETETLRIATVLGSELVTTRGGSRAEPGHL